MSAFFWQKNRCRSIAILWFHPICFLKETGQGRPDHTKDTFEVEFRINRTDGSTCWVKARGEVYCDDDSQPKHLMGTTIDISSQKELEQQLVSKINEIQTLKQKLEQENALLHQQIDSHFLDDEIIAGSKEMNHVLSLVEQVALTVADLRSGIGFCCTWGEAKHPAVKDEKTRYPASEKQSPIKRRYAVIAANIYFPDILEKTLTKPQYPIIKISYTPNLHYLLFWHIFRSCLNQNSDAPYTKQDQVILNPDADKLKA